MSQPLTSKISTESFIFLENYLDKTEKDILKTIDSLFNETANFQPHERLFKLWNISFKQNKLFLCKSKKP